MQVVIDIPDDMWEKVKDGYVPLGIEKYLINGTPLSKGQLIDKDERLIILSKALLTIADAESYTYGQDDAVKIAEQIIKDVANRKGGSE